MSSGPDGACLAEHGGRDVDADRFGPSPARYRLIRPCPQARSNTRSPATAGSRSAWAAISGGASHRSQAPHPGSRELQLLPKIGDHEDSTFPQLAREGRLGGFRIEGYWRGVNTVKDIMEASAEFAASS
jgi:hypothetical protein